jgi:pimeloyl-ACP methyl ester carboxylesterase
MLPYHIEGKGNPLLLIHGWGVTYTVWQKLVPLLAPHFQLILVELPGLGGASEIVPGKPYYKACAEALDELRIALNIEEWAVLAYSTGTRVSEIYVQRYPQRVTRAVFLCPIYLRKSWQMALQVGQWADSNGLRVINWLISGWRLYGLLLALGFNLRRRDCVNEWMSEIALQPLDNLKRMLLELPNKGRAPFILPTSLSVPTLFVWGSQDALTARPPYSRPNDVFIFANHSAPVLNPDKVVAVVLPFLNAELELQHIPERSSQGV